MGGTGSFDTMLASLMVCGNGFVLSCFRNIRKQSFLILVLAWERLRSTHRLLLVRREGPRQSGLIGYFSPMDHCAFSSTTTSLPYCFQDGQLPSRTISAAIHF